MTTNIQEWWSGAELQFSGSNRDFDFSESCKVSWAVVKNKWENRLSRSHCTRKSISRVYSLGLSKSLKFEQKFHVRCADGFLKCKWYGLGGEKFIVLCLSDRRYNLVELWCEALGAPHVRRQRRSLNSSLKVNTNCEIMCQISRLWGREESGPTDNLISASWMLHKELLS